ncbi:sugar nucleotide-binding protein [uncultured Tissierella sp.]|uniref:sugar nucleotide-binding protein n=1 Tax=uncultured Tissierella sp. TaxID=448160 RepID=UPI00280496F5|nr:sugar nucleotide-binding protein [uncultured Tissierella sp.]MDU5082854.1 sugar nucleotide-binding protein [Bacillota bacterium]
MERILILGASGLVGKALSKELDKKYDVYGTYNNNKIVSINSIYYDMSEVNKIINILNSVKPSRIVYCLTGNFKTQIELLNELIRYLIPINGKLYFCSTANVFDGDTTIPHPKTHEPIAKSDYGKFKIECEKILRKDLNGNGIIFRLPMIWGKDSPRLNSLVTSLKNNEKVDVYTNLYLNNNTDEMLAKQIYYIIENDLEGIFHLGSSEVINHYEFIKKVIVKLGYKDTKFNEETLPGEKYYLAVLPTIKELATDFIFSNEHVINHITE